MPGVVPVGCAVATRESHTLGQGNHVAATYISLAPMYLAPQTTICTASNTDLGPRLCGIDGLLDAGVSGRIATRGAGRSSRERNAEYLSRWWRTLACLT